MKTLKQTCRANQNRLITITTALSLSPLFSTSCSKMHPTSLSRTDSVEIPQTSVKNQFAIGFCWSYATLALIESNHKLRSGEDIDLSEEALGYVHMRQELLLLAKKYRAGEISLDNAMEQLADRGLEGWFVRASNSSGRDDAMELVDIYGVVPESVWSKKFTTRDQVSSLKKAIAAPFGDLLMSSGSVNNNALDAVLTVPGAFDSPPPSHFDFKGKNYSAKSFAQQYLDFSSKDYVLMQAQTASNVQKLVMATKRAMASGYSIPVSFGVSMNNLKNGFFRANDLEISALEANPDLSSSVITLTGSHAMVATDFVNRGGREGQLPPDELESEVKKSANELSYFKFKNSWGAHASVTENGVDVTSGQDGYYRMDYAYIKAVAAKGRFGVVVPKKFAE